jgi:hypothetical protein
MIYADVLAKSGEAAKSGPIGLAVILVLCVLCYFLFKSMSRHLKTVRENFPKPEARPMAAQGREAGPVAPPETRSPSSDRDEPAPPPS